MNTTATSRKQITVVVSDEEIRSFKRTVNVAGGTVTSSFMRGGLLGGYTVTYVI